MGSAKTSFRLRREQPAAVSADSVIVPVFKEAKTAAGNKKAPEAGFVWTDPLKALDKALQGQLDAAARDEKFDGGKGKLLVLRKGAKDTVKARRIILVGLGEAGKLNARTWESNLLKALGSALAIQNPHAVAISLPGNSVLETDVLVDGAVDAVYQATYRSMEAKEKSPDLQTVLLLTESAANAPLEAALSQAQVVAAARSFVKDLVNHPANLKRTDTLADAAKTLGKKGLEVKVQANPAWIEKHMPCFFTVAKGALATDPPKFITLRYTPKGAKKHVAVVGKSVIFDTGGYQVKPGDYMVTMKGDMTGGAVALAVMQALAALKPAHIAVSAYLAATPNKIDSDAMIPDSVVNTTCGKKVEIRHTDAEGRLTLIDAVAMAAETKPDEIITVATLTGSASQAVGLYIALMGNDDELRGRIERAGKRVGEPIQTLDVTEDDFDNIKSKLDSADIINTQQRKNRGAQCAAAFVMSGAPEGIPMAHMDIAGADMTPDEKATGISLKTVLYYLLEEDRRLSNGPTPQNQAPATGKSRASAPSAKASGRKSIQKKASAKTGTAKTTQKPASGRKPAPVKSRKK